MSAFCWASATDVGCVRDENQDAAFGDTDAGLFLVADGIGGSQAGAIAARAAAEVLPKNIACRLNALSRIRSRSIRYWLRRELCDFGTQLRVEAGTRLGLRGMGTTVVVALFDQGCVHVAHLGDSRAYLFRDRQLQQLTEDHSVVALLLRMGEITPAEAVEHPARCQLTQYLGMQEEAIADVQTVRVTAGDRLLLCTDGLTNMLPDPEIAELLAHYASSHDACNALVDSANVAGGRDNITVLIVDIAQGITHGI